MNEKQKLRTIRTFRGINVEMIPAASIRLGECVRMFNEPFGCHEYSLRYEDEVLITLLKPCMDMIVQKIKDNNDSVGSRTVTLSRPYGQYAEFAKTCYLNSETVDCVCTNTRDAWHFIKIAGY